MNDTVPLGPRQGPAR